MSILRKIRRANDVLQLLGMEAVLSMNAKFETMKTRVKSLFLTLIMMLAMSGGNPFSLVAYATGPTGSTNPNDIFNIVSDSGEINTSSSVAQQNTNGSFSTIITKYRSIATAIMGILTITMLIFMLIQFTKLGAAGDNEMARKKAIMGILTTGIATALLGGATIVVGFFWGALAGA